MHMLMHILPRIKVLTRTLRRYNYTRTLTQEHTDTLLSLSKKDMASLTLFALKH